MTVYDNIAFPLKMRKIAADKIRTMTGEALELVKLPGFETRYPQSVERRSAAADCFSPGHCVSTENSPDG